MVVTVMNTICVMMHTLVSCSTDKLGLQEWGKYIFFRWECTPVFGTGDMTGIDRRHRHGHGHGPAGRGKRNAGGCEAGGRAWGRRGHARTGRE